MIIKMTFSGVLKNAVPMLYEIQSKMLKEYSKDIEEGKLKVYVEDNCLVSEIDDPEAEKKFKVSLKQNAMLRTMRPLGLKVEIIR